MAKFLYLFVLALGCFTGAQAQLRTISGYLRDSSTQAPITSGTITNFNTGRSVKTDNLGFFRLRVSPNDRIYAIAGAYRFDTLTYSTLFADTVTIYLSPTGALLPGVTVTSQYSKYQLDSIERRKAFEAARGPVMPTIASTPSTGFGLTINMDKFWKKGARQKKLLERTYRQNEEEAYIHYRYAHELVSSYTGLKGEELKAFMQRYTPSYTWLRDHPTDEAVLNYVNEKMKEFARRKK